MLKSNQDILVKRLKSFAWRLGVMCAVALLNFISENIGLSGMSPALQVLAGLVIAEITKFLNTEYAPFVGIR